MSQVVVKDERTTFKFPKVVFSSLELNSLLCFDSQPGKVYRKSGMGSTELLTGDEAPLWEPCNSAVMVRPRPDLRLTMILENA